MAKILICDDESGLRSVIKRYAQLDGHETVEAANGTEALEACKKEQFDIILMDIMMPDLDGFSAVKEIRKTSDVPVIMISARGEEYDKVLGFELGIDDYIVKPFSSKEIMLKITALLKRIEVHLLAEEKRKVLERQNTELIYFNDNLQEMLREKTQDVSDLQNALLKTMAEMVEYRDFVTGSHIERTQQGIKILLDEIERKGLFREETAGWDTNLLLQSSRLHDVGKISISDHILKKPGKLNDEEYTEMKKHVVSGVQIINKIEDLTKKHEFLRYAEVFAASHHEKWDGTGYHRGLKGNEIPLLGRIMAVADVYDALISERPYKKAFTHEEAVRIITESSGKQFDPALVEVFAGTAEQFGGMSR